MCYTFILCESLKTKISKPSFLITSINYFQLKAVLYLPLKLEMILIVLMFVNVVQTVDTKF